ncbi:MAG: DASS family sodium-coupled anion symporter [Phycisphaera sp.]|nr:DASS family sodium-coupled anion symporter [Phycisphaera sp.]
MSNGHTTNVLSRIALFGGVILAEVVWLAAYQVMGHNFALAWTAAITTWCAVWWIFEAVPIAITSMIPFVMFPLVGVLNQKQVAEAYGDKLVLLFLGGFILSKAMEKSGAHRRLALMMVRGIGRGGGKLMVLAFMIATAGLSMWISNTATVLMLLPIIIAVLQQTEDESLPIPLLLGVAYASSIGGVATPIGTPPNGVFLSVYSGLADKHTHIDPISFLEWMTIGLPVVVIMLPLAWLWLCRRIKGRHDIKLPDTGPWRAEEVRVLIVFAMTALLWITRSEPFGGWSGLVDYAIVPDGKLDVYDSTVALAMVLVMFLVPDGKGGRLLDWPTAVKIPWGILILFGGGIAIATAFKSSGLSTELGHALSSLTSMHVIVMMAGLCLVVTFLTEVTSNTATAAVLMPILAAAAITAGIDPRLLMIPAAVSCSMAFMLPVATPPNAIVFSDERITIKDMAREGLVLNFIGVVVITLVMYVRLTMF